MKKLLLLLIFASFLSAAILQAQPLNLRCENLENPIGVDVSAPRFSWQLTGTGRNIQQTAYEITVQAGKQIVWNSGKVNSAQSVMLPYAGKPLQSATQYSWKVRVWTNKGEVSGWSKEAFFYMGFLQPSQWTAAWITPGFTEDSIMRPSPLFRKEFSTTKKIVSAHAFITAHGLYEASINGQRVGDAYLTPGWTSYNKRLQYQVYDVTHLLTKGNNAIGVTLGSGWYRGSIGFSRPNFNIYGKDIGLLFQLKIGYSDGSSQTILSDGTWKTATGAIRYSEIYNGETIDASKEQAGWLMPGFNDAQWTAAKTANFSKSHLIATRNEPVKKHETFAPVKIFTTPKGEQVIDFGQNLVGWVVLKTKAKAGDSIKLYHAEVLDKKGNFYIDNLRGAKCLNTYVFKGSNDAETFEPHFTWQGFRYVKVEGYKRALNAADFTAVALYSDMQKTGTFESSNALINQLQHNIEWGQKGNFLDVPTDCPQRDERLGWTGDAQVFSRTAAFNMNVHNFFVKWLQDVEADQVSGKVPYVIPNVLDTNGVNSTGWSDVATIIPWNMYLAYGDKQILENQFTSMKAYVESIRKSSKNDLWNTGFHFGDWLFYRPEDDNDGNAAVTDKYLIAQCFYAHSTQLLVNAANVLGKKEEAQVYTALLEKIKAAFLKEYVTANGRLVSSTQTAYTLALQFDMLPESLRQQAADRLVLNLSNYGYHLTTGFLGTPYLCHVLTRFGYTDHAYKLLLQESYPSWLYPVKNGATTIWERWDGQKPDGSFQTPGMNSFNHYAYGAIGDWMYRKMVGLDTYEDGPGYQHIKVQPHIGGGFTHASASLQTNYGKLSSGWKLEGNKLTMHVEIPANTTATVYVPAKTVESVTENGKPVNTHTDIKMQGLENGYVVLQVGSGMYVFETEK
ncbi:MAG TPA: glycoside hydrolase family 78 protein [Phnomibacter sp.]|nr:glycoside hydrolase family 78 protein [Phnomibacter sp.]